MRRVVLPLCTLLFSLAGSAGCSSEDSTENDAGGTGGSAASAGAGAGGTSGSGGSASGAGGSTAGSAGSGGSTAGSAGSAGSGAGAPPTDSPSDTSQAGIEAFLAAGTYKTSDWVADVAAPRDSGASNHQMVRVWFNKTLRQSQADGETTRDSGSMVVKELYDSASAVVGHAAMLRSGTSWIYYCTASEAGRCFGGQAAAQKIYSMSATGSCSCHGGGTVITPIPAP